LSLKIPTLSLKKVSYVKKIGYIYTINNEQLNYAKTNEVQVQKRSIRQI